MRKSRIIRSVFVLISALTVCAAHAWAQDTNWRNNRQARTVVNRLITNSNSFRREIQRARYPWDNNTTSEEHLSDMISAFSNSLTSLRSSLNTNSNAKDEVDGVLSRASRINMFLDRNRVTSRAQSRWTSIRTDVNTLAGYYNIAWNWNTPYPSGGVPGGGYGTRGSLTGTYRLDTRLSDNITTVVDRSVRLYAANQRDRVRRALERRLSSPDMIVIDRNGRTITMASSLQPQVTFEADGVAKSETNPRGRTVTTTVSQTANGFTVNYAGDRMNDFTVSFDVDRDGRLRVERRIYLENRNDTVTATSVYDRVNGIAQWSAITPQTTGPWYNNTGSTGQFYIPNGITLTARLRNTVNTRASQVGDLFTMDVTSPNEFRGSVIRGHVSETSRSGRLSGRANMQLDFDTITVNGREYAFAGMIDSVTAANGDSVSVNNEGTIRDNNQTTKTVTRAGIGAVLGAVIGAIAGGGEGAAIGAGVGAGAGAGSVLVGGRDNIELGTGSTFTITASAPANAAFIRRN